MTTIQNNSDLLGFLIRQSDSGVKNWFGFHQQRITGINLAYDIARCHADKLTPTEVVDYVIALNNQIYTKIIKGD